MSEGFFFRAIMWTQQGLKSLHLQSHLKSFCTENKLSRATAWMTDSLLLPSAAFTFVLDTRANPQCKKQNVTVIGLFL